MITLKTHTHMHTHTHTHTHTHIYILYIYVCIYIYIERERKSSTNVNNKMSANVLQVCNVYKFPLINKAPLWLWFVLHFAVYQ